MYMGRRRHYVAYVRTNKVDKWTFIDALEGEAEDGYNIKSEKLEILEGQLKDTDNVVIS